MMRGNSAVSKSARSYPPSAHEWRSSDSPFGIAIAAGDVVRVLGYCRAAADRETGGILTGHYSENHDAALITGVTGPPPDSRSSRAIFVRGVRGLQRLLNELWHRQAGYYLGEWHFHPAGDGMPSGTDREQMGRTARSGAYNCPEPVLVIVAKPSGMSWVMRAFAYPDGRQVELEATAENSLPMSPDGR
jgi:integrative and conjugative element protein (TIGR02256 family)